MDPHTAAGRREGRARLTPPRPGGPTVYSPTQGASRSAASGRQLCLQSRVPLGRCGRAHYLPALAAGQAVAGAGCARACASRSWCRSRAGGSRGSSASARSRDALAPGGFLTAVCAGGLYTGPPLLQLLVLVLERPEGLLHHGVIAQRARAVPAAHTGRSLRRFSTAHARRASRPSSPGGRRGRKGTRVDGAASPNGRGLEEEEQKLQSGQPPVGSPAGQSHLPANCPSWTDRLPAPFPGREPRPHRQRRRGPLTEVSRRPGGWPVPTAAREQVRTQPTSKGSTPQGRQTCASAASTARSLRGEHYQDLPAPEQVLKFRENVPVKRSGTPASGPKASVGRTKAQSRARRSPGPPSSRRPPCTRPRPVPAGHPRAGSAPTLPRVPDPAGPPCACPLKSSHAVSPPTGPLAP